MAEKEEKLTIKSIDDAIDNGKNDICLELKLRNTFLTSKCKKCSFYSTYSLSCFIDFYRDLRVEITGRNGRGGKEMKVECDNPQEYRRQMVKSLDDVVDSSFMLDGRDLHDDSLFVIFQSGQCLKEEDVLCEEDVPKIKVGLKTVHSPCFKSGGADCFFELIEKGHRYYCLLNAYYKMRINMLAFVAKYNTNGSED